MNPILTITRTHPDGTTSSHVLTAAGDQPGYLLVGTHHDSPGTTDHLDAQTPVEAVAAHRQLRTVDGRDSTEIVRHQPAELDSDDLLDALRPTRNATDLNHEDQEEAFLAWDWPLEEAAGSWATWHRVTLDGRPLYGVPVNQRQVVLVPGDATRPYEEWKAILAFDWDSSTYSGVGMSGFGSNGLYLIRPGLVALVNATDEEVDVRVQRVNRRTRMEALVRRHLSSFEAGDRSYAQLALAAHGFSAEDVYPDDGLSTMLSPRELHRLLDPPAK